VWETVPPLLADIVRDVVSPYGVAAEVTHVRGVPPVVNDLAAVDTLTRAATAYVGPGSVCGTEQSLGGEDFGWYLEKVPGALARLGVGTTTLGAAAADLHHPEFDVDEGAIGVGVALLAGVALVG
jgi:amidohydrolase